jgi:hypothetical protein
LVRTYFHAFYGGSEALIDILTLNFIRGNMPGRALGLIVEWATVHRVELLEDWDLCRMGQPAKMIVPLP